MPFKHIDLNLVEPDFGSQLTDIIMDLNHLRRKQIRGTTHRLIFRQIKNIYHILESIGSARIEGNRTTIAEYVESIIENETSKDENSREIHNMQKAHDYIDECISDCGLDGIFVSELHQLVVNDLSPPPNGEGSQYPGQYRNHSVQITGASHTPPEHVQIREYMDELFNFINTHDSPQYDLLKVAISHHRFAWIHPFDNGNGRTVRLFTYAMLVKLGFNIKSFRIVNPSTIFCMDREDYYRHLSLADSGKSSAMLDWCEFVLSGLKDEIDKIDNLLNHHYLAKNILIHAISLSLKRKTITPEESKVLGLCVMKYGKIQAKDIKDIYPGKSSATISRMIKELKNKRMLVPEEKNARTYVINFDNNYLLRGVIEMLDKNGFIKIK